MTVKDEQFVEQIEPHRRAITLHCYRMLGSFQDAEEVAQESLLRAWQGFAELKSSTAMRAWLYKIATNACLDVLKARRRRTLPHLLTASANPALPLGPPHHEERWLEPAPDVVVEAAENPEARVSLRESISLAFVTAIHHLSAKQRAVLLLVDVLGWRPNEAAQLLDTTVVSVNSLLQRARRSMETRPVVASDASSANEAALVRRYVETWESGDIDGLAALLAEDAILSMPPQRPSPSGSRGAATSSLFSRRCFRRGLANIDCCRFARMAGRPSPCIDSVRAGSRMKQQQITVLSVRNGRIAEMVRFALPQLFARFGLAARLEQ